MATVNFWSNQTGDLKEYQTTNTTRNLTYKSWRTLCF